MTVMTVEVSPQQHGSDANLHARFYIYPGDDLLHLEVMNPGDRNTVYDLLIDETNRDKWIGRFPNAWDEYDGDGDALEGQTRLNQVAWMHESMQTDLAHVRVLTVEHLAGMSDMTVSRCGVRGVMAMREKARAFVEEKARLGQFDEIEDRNRTLEKRIAALEAREKEAGTAAKKKVRATAAGAAPEAGKK